jgi:hypothetical protein
VRCRGLAVAQGGVRDGVRERVPKAAGDEKAGERKEEDNADPAGACEHADAVNKGVMGVEAAAVVEEEDHQDGYAAQAIERGVATRRSADVGGGHSASVEA